MFLGSRGVAVVLISDESHPDKVCLPRITNRAPIALLSAGAAFWQKCLATKSYVSGPTTSEPLIDMAECCRCDAFRPSHNTGQPY